MSLGRLLPRWVKDGSFDEEWEDAPQRGDTVQVRVEFTEDLETADGEEWSHALLRGRARQTDEMAVTAMVAPTSKQPPKKLEGFWDVKLVRDGEGKPWRLEQMTRRRG
ncbi:MAG: hypothetical protein JNK82_27875 [Myxococcaceae bacterium]|nr:hypothetical protein [Myxococcaceae bacterium]